MDPVTNNELPDDTSEMVEEMGEALFGTDDSDSGDAAPSELADSDIGGEDAKPPVDKPVDAPVAGDPAKTTETKPTEPSTSPTFDPAVLPSTWRKELAAKWASIDPEVRAEIAKRESDMMRGIAEYKETSEFGKQAQQWLAQYEPITRMHGTDPLSFAQASANVYARMLTGSKDDQIAIISELAGSLGLGVQDFGGTAGEPTDPDFAPVVDPHVAHLQNEFQRVNMRLSASEQALRNTAIEKLRSEIAEFASKPENKYFDEVANDIARLINTGAARDLPSAYRLAIRANDQVWSKLEAERAAADAAKRKADEDAKAKQQQEAAAKARKAVGANVRSGAKMVVKRGKDASDETIEDTLNEVMSRHFKD